MIDNCQEVEESIAEIIRTQSMDISTLFPSIGGQWHFESVFIHLPTAKKTKSGVYRANAGDGEEDDLREIVPLIGINAEVVIFHNCVKMELTQTFYNSTDSPLEVVYSKLVQTSTRLK